MKQIPVRLGPLALLLTVITICLAVLSLLALTTARADLKLAERAADTQARRYALEEEANRFLLELENGSAEGAVTDGAEGLIRKTFASDGFFLETEFKKTAGGYEIVSFRSGREWEEDTEINIWDGNRE